MTALFWKACAGVLMVAILVLFLGKQEKDLALLLGMAACAGVLTTAFWYLEPVLEFLRRLETLGNLQSGMMSTILKITGIGLVSEFASMICQDGGNASLAKGMHLLAGAVILSLSLPVMETLLDLMETILGGL